MQRFHHTSHGSIIQASMSHSDIRIEHGVKERIRFRRVASPFDQKVNQAAETDEHYDSQNNPTTIGHSCKSWTHQRMRPEKNITFR